MSRRPKKSPRRAALYARVSTDRQKEKGTIESQLLALREYCAAHDLQIVLEKTDEGTSAAPTSLKHRPGYLAILQAARTRSFDVLVVTAIDRMTRAGQAGRGIAIGQVTELGIPIIALNLGMEIDPSTPHGDMTLAIMGSMAHQESKNHAARVQMGIRRQQKQGRMTSGRPPWGYRWVKDGQGAGHMEVDEAKAEIVREIFRRMVAGENRCALSRELTARGLGRAFPQPVLYRMVKQRAYIGEWHLKHGTVQTPPIIDPELWARAQKIQPIGALNRKRTRHPHLCSGLATCGYCDGPIRVYAAHTDRGSPRPGKYACRDRCGVKRWLQQRCDQLVWSAIEEVLVVRWGELKQEILEYLQHQDAAAGCRTELDVMRELKRVRKKEQQYCDLFRHDRISFEELNRQQAALCARRDELLAEKAALVQTQPDFVRAFAELQRCIGTATTAPERRAIVEAVVEPNGITLFHTQPLEVNLHIRETQQPGVIR